MTSKKDAKKAASPEKEYRSLTGHNFINEETGKENRVDAGEKIVGMSASSLRHEIEAGNVEEWVPYDTDNVVDDAEAEVVGSRIRRQDGELTVKEVN